MTIAAVEDLAYTVDTSVAEPYAIPGCAPLCGSPPAVPRAADDPAGGFWLGDHVLVQPLVVRLPDGRLVRVRPPAEGGR